MTSTRRSGDLRSGVALRLRVNGRGVEPSNPVMARLVSILALGVVPGRVLDTLSNSVACVTGSQAPPASAVANVAR